MSGVPAPDFLFITYVLQVVKKTRQPETPGTYGAYRQHAPQQPIYPPMPQRQPDQPFPKSVPAIFMFFHCPPFTNKKIPLRGNIKTCQNHPVFDRFCKAASATNGRMRLLLFPK